MTNLAQGKGFQAQARMAGSSVTLATSTSNYITVNLYFNLVGSTIPTTLVGLQLPPSLPNELLLTHITAFFNTTGARGACLVRLYKVGTLNLAVTGDQFTHDAATFPITETKFTETLKPKNLIPILYVTTATTVTAPIITLKTAAGGAGYTDQDGNNVVGTRTFTFPAAATLAGSGYILRTEDEDSGVRNISAIQVNTAASAGAATIFLMENLGVLNAPSGGAGCTLDSMFGGLRMQDLKEAPSTAGTPTSYLGVATFTTATGAGATPEIIFQGVLNAT